MQSVSSTNDYLLAQIKNGTELKQYFTVLAEEQTMGRGRMGRQWLSPFGKNLYLSQYSQFHGVHAELAGLSLVVGIAVVESLQQVGLTQAKVKWPNDVYYNGKKICGILIETISSVPLKLLHVVVGIGLNVADSTEIAKKIQRPCTDITTNLGYNVSRNELAAIVMFNVKQIMHLFHQDGFGAFAAMWDKVDLLQGKQIEVLSANSLHCGVAEGVDTTGALCLDCNGKKQRIHHGSVSEIAC